MKTFTYVLSVFAAVALSIPANAQVVIGTSTASSADYNTIDDGAILQLKSEDKGLMIPNVALQSRSDVTTITATEVEGLWVYNTATNGSGLDAVSPGFYFWNGSAWEKIFNDGYTIQFEQSETLRVPDLDTYTIPGLDQTFVAPYTGVYEFHVSGYIGAPNHDNTSEEATVHGSYMLEIDGTTVGESTVSSNTKVVPNAFQCLGRQTTIVHLVTLNEGTSYDVRVRARLWDHENVDASSLDVTSFCGGAASGLAFFGICSGPYNGNDGLTDNAHDAYLTITMVQQL